MVDELRLRPLRLEDEHVARAAHHTLDAAGYTFLLGHDERTPWPEFVEQVERHRRGLDLPPDRMPAAFLLAWVGGELVGRASIRLQLDDHLAAAGGHIGYAVLPAHRRRGYATEILRQSLIIARAEGIDEALITCDVANEGSRRVIERCGGELESIVHDPKEGVDKRRYWVR